MPLQATSGAASYDAFGGGVAAVPTYIEEVFSTYLYTGNNSSQTITNGIDLSGKGGLVWTKSRSNVNAHWWVDTVRGVGNYIDSAQTAAQGNDVNVIPSFLSTGYTTGSNLSISPRTYVSWTFREQPKFFDIVTYTGNGTTQNISHNLGSVPGMIIVKKTSALGDWAVWHRGLTSGRFIYLDLTLAEQTAGATATFGNNTVTVDPTSSVFTIGSSGDVNTNGATYVAYIYAHNAGGFGLAGTDNVISCGSFVSATAGTTVSLGYEPQWVIVKQSSAAGDDWHIIDTMRKWTDGGTAESSDPDYFLNANTAAAEGTGTSYGYPTANGFFVRNIGNGVTCIYIAIRRGPMKVPTTGTSVFSPVAQNASNPTSTVTTNFPVDFTISAQRSKAQSLNTWVLDRLRGSSKASGEFLKTNVDGSQQTLVAFGLDNNSGYVDNFWGNATDGVGATSSIAYWNFKRAPSFMDVVCYTGTGADQSVAHNLGVAPEFKIIKCRSNATTDWEVKHTATGRNDLALNSTSAAPYQTSTFWSANADTASLFYTRVNSNDNVNTSGRTYVAYLFATCAGVSKVFSYTGNGSSQTINCGFTGGARFVLIKRTDNTGDWYVWDSARGIVSGNDPHLSLNTTAAEVTTDDTIDTDSTGFVVNQVSATNVNVSSATYIGLAIA